MRGVGKMIVAGASMLAAMACQTCVHAQENTGLTIDNATIIAASRSLGERSQTRVNLVYSGSFSQTEKSRHFGFQVPQVFQHEARWYCLFCMAEPHQAEWNRTKNGPSGTGNHYLIGKSPRGPWRIPDGPALDVNCDRYAARIVDHDGLKIIGFKDGGRENFGGYIMDPAPVFTRPNGTLTLEP